VVLVASIPLALEIVVTTTLAIGSRELAHDGAIVTRLAAIEDLSGMNILCSDKTGTLTLNKMVIQKDTPTFMAGLNQEKVRPDCYASS
jgi:H+-transporting ATPase